MCGSAVGGFADEQVRFLAGDLGGDEMAVIFARVVASEHNFETSNLNEEHGATEDVTGVVRRDGDAGVGEGGMVVDGLDARVGGEMVRFSVESFGGVVNVAGCVSFIGALDRLVCGMQCTYLTRTLSWINHL